MSKVMNMPVKKQTTRMLKVCCTKCDWAARTTSKHLRLSGGAQDTLNCPVPMCLGELLRA